VLATVTVVLPETDPTVAVTVITVAAAMFFADSVAVAWPVALVVPEVTANVPALVANVTTAPSTATLFASVAVTVIVAVVPSGGSVAALEETESFATLDVPAGALLLLDGTNAVLSPPQPARVAARVSSARVDQSLRMSHLKIRCDKDYSNTGQ
jgi:hypothetical protein